MGCTQAVQPVFVEEAVRPTLMVLAARPAAPSASLAQDAAQATANPAVQVAEDGPVTVSKVREPSAQLRTQPGTDDRAGIARWCASSSPAPRP